MKMKKYTQYFLCAMVCLIFFIVPVSAASIQMNKSSVTIVSGETYQLKVLVDGVAKSAAWGSSNPSVATVSSDGMVTGKAAGSAVISAMVEGTTVECLVSVLKKTESSTKRYNVMILDASKSMLGEPSSQQKVAALRFCKKLLATSGENYIAIVTLNSNPKVVCNFTQNYSTLSKKINSISSTGKTNMNGALNVAYKLLKNITDSSTTVKNVILCSDGLPTMGSKKTSGRYTDADHSFYAQANSVYNMAYSVKKKDIFIYALGFFHNSVDKDLVFGKRLMKDLASKDKYYIIQEPDSLNEVFEQIAEEITTITLNKSEVSMYEGKTYRLRAVTSGEASDVKWSSSNSSVAIVSSSGLVKGKKAGTAIITATVNGVKSTCKVTVLKSSITLDKKSIELYLKGTKTATLKATVKPSATITWSSSNRSVATVSNGKVTAKRVGKCTITAKANGKVARCTVTVKKNPVYKIYTVKQLQEVSKNMEAEYILMRDLDLSGIKEWEPIGTLEKPFMGTFNGNGHKIKNLKITTALDHRGLFGYVKTGKILNLTVSGKITISSTTTYVGGIAGQIDKGSLVRKCNNRVEVSGVHQVGGVVGRVSESTMEKCNNYATIKATGRCVGGVTSDVYPSGTLTSCRNYGRVEGNGWLTGGISGGCTRGIVNDCHNYGVVVGGGKGLIGDTSGYTGTNNTTI